jgi:hypothetical protein
VLLVAMQLPVYMVHQAEEHLGDRFRIDINRMAGCEALTRPATFWINLLGVWLVDLVALALTVTVDPAWGLLAAYLALVNGAVHALVAIARRERNPGLITAIALLLPMGAWCLWCLRTAASASPGVHVASVAIVVAVHGAIIAWVAARRHALRSTRTPR